MARQPDNEPARATDRGVLLRVKAQPRAQSPGVRGVRNGALVVRLKAAPDRGRANDELIDALASFLDAPRAGIEIVSGHAARDKRALIRNITLERVNSRLRGLPVL